MTLYIWDEITQEVAAGPADPDTTGWRLVECFDNEVRQFVSDRGHVALEVDADTPEQADEMFREASFFYRDTMETLEADRADPAPEVDRTLRNKRGELVFPKFPPVKQPWHR